MGARLFLLLTALFVSSSAWAAQMPESEMNALSGDVVHVPADFKGKPTLVILAFAHEQREEAARVMQLLQQASEQNDALTWYEMPVIDAPSVAHFFIKNGMRDGTDEQLHAHIVPQFVDKADWHQTSGIQGTEPLLVKVDQKGAILKSKPLGGLKTVSDIATF